MASSRGGQWPKDDLGLTISPLPDAMRSINMLRVFFFFSFFFCKTGLALP